MSSLPPVYKSLHASSTSSGHTSDFVGLIWSQGACGTQGQGLTVGSEFDLTEMSDVECSHFQQFIQMQMEPGLSDTPKASPPPAALVVQDASCSTWISPRTSSQAIDLTTSTSNDYHSLVMPGEKTPVFYGEVPSFVLARIGGEESPIKAAMKEGASSKNRARVCLEKRFNSMCPETTRQQDSCSAVVSNLLTVFQHSAEAQEAFTHSQTQKWVKADQANPFKVSSSHVGGVSDPITNVFGQVIAHMAEPNTHQGLIMSPSFSFNFYPESSVTKTVCPDSNNPREEEELAITESTMSGAQHAVYRGHRSSPCSEPVKAAKTASNPSRKSRKGGCKRARSCISLTQRRERHNSIERERRKRIRLCCDELNTMVPFCDSSTDKVTTLQWTTAFLRYINQMYGDSFKEEFQTIFKKERKEFFKSSASSGQQPSNPNSDDTLSTPLAAEQ
ncbi:transcription factor-like 5 protein isoform X1 [Girardinichthys multiradiatus]|uniref:transcription factor-like 5 protein isoform X1 n=1 Tax=Girardinichthys multiradiatus TaxID=208333 RepID=UPI001FAB566B|nr:transcription factor-like 5 protein isoform X1 [Girardinichthys multiradiatus]